MELSVFLGMLNDPRANTAPQFLGDIFRCVFLNRSQFSSKGQALDATALTTARTV
ncbi:hypothetical protein CDVA01_0687 [Corynebacterium diphtheriae VA01]|nr:hypothetical protein CDVA01_0687 [Corynebacterium diphtheriae VA01]